MDAVPPGMISFLYNVMYDPEMNANFRKDPYKVMEFFQLSDEQQQLVQSAGMDILELRLQKEAALAEQQEEAQKKGAAAAVRAVKFLKDTVPMAQIQEVVEKTHARSAFKKQLNELVLAAVAEELKKGHGHFW